MHSSGQWLLVVTGLLLALSCRGVELDRARPAFPAGELAGPAPFVGYHRYRGTLGSQRITVELTFSAGRGKYEPPACSGTCRFVGQPTQLHLLESRQPYAPGRPLRLLEADSGRAALNCGYWQTLGPAGPLLRGTWNGLAGEQLPFELREDYRDEAGLLAAVPYEELSESALLVGHEYLTLAQWNARCFGAKPGPPEKCDPQVSVQRGFLHFPGPDSLRPAVAAIQGPPPAERRAQALSTLQEVVGDSSREFSSSTAEEDSQSLDVLFNDGGLLCWRDFRYYYSGGAHGGHSLAFLVYDLNTGEFLTLADVLRPAAQRGICRLLTQHLQTEQDFPASALRQQADYADVVLAPLPQSGFAIADQGLVFQYNDYEIGGYIDGINEMVLPWAELQPLLRPDSPLARLLRARGLWHPAK